MSSLRERAIEVLRKNDRGGYTVPAPQLYPHQWTWDSAFAAIGWATFDLDRALSELEAVFEGQWDDGRVPHIRFRVDTADYFPGPKVWGRQQSSSITTPPVFAPAARRLVERGLAVQRIEPLLAAIDRSHRFFYAQRDPLGWNLAAVVHPWESGRDNGPEWDGPLSAVDPAAAPPFTRVDKKFVASPDERPDDVTYQRYIALVDAIRKAGFGPGPFAVYDPCTSALLARAEQDLAWLGERAGFATEAAQRATGVRGALVSRLWDEQHGRFRFFDARSETGASPDVLAAHLALIVELPERQRARLVAELDERYAAAWPLPTTAPGAPPFHPRCYWRGPSWVNMNWLLAPAYDRGLRERTLELVERSGFHEYFDPLTGDGLGTDRFTWTAALVLDWLS